MCMCTCVCGQGGAANALICLPASPGRESWSLREGGGGSFSLGGEGEGHVAPHSHSPSGSTAAERYSKEGTKEHEL